MVELGDMVGVDEGSWTSNPRAHRVHQCNDLIQAAIDGQGLALGVIR